MFHSRSVWTNHKKASATKHEIWIINIDAVMRGSDFILTQINCAHTLNHHHHHSPRTPQNLPTVDLSGWDQTEGILDGDNDLLTETEGGRVEAHAGDRWSCVSCDRAGVGWCAGVWVWGKGGERQGLELGGGCVTLFWWGYSCYNWPRRISLIQEISGMSFCCQSQLLRCVSEHCGWLTDTTFHLLLVIVASLNRCEKNTYEMWRNQSWGRVTSWWGTNIAQ